MMDKVQALIFGLLADDRDIVTYRKKLNKITGSVTATILLQQLIYWAKKSNGKPFYKFRKECKHAHYKPGDSWTEELGFTLSEFDTALSKIGTKITKGVSKFDALKGETAKSLVIYWTDSNRMTWYLLNTELLGKLTIPIYLESKESGFTYGIVNPDLPESETTPETTPNNGLANAAANLDEWFPESTHNGRKPEHDSLLAQIQNGSTEQANQARLIALGLAAKEQAPSTGLEQIERSGWNIKDDRIRQGMAIFLEAVPLPVPVSRSERGQWQKGISAHLEEFGLAGLKELYHTAWNEYLPDITAGKLDITHPLALTRKMRGIRNRPQPVAQEAKYFIDPDTGERIKW